MLVKSPATTNSREADESASIQRGRSSLFEKSSQPKMEKSISNPRRNEEILTIPDGSFNLIRFDSVSFTNNPNPFLQNSSDFRQ